MDIYLRAHIKALTENIELINVAFIVALFADCVWITSDIILSGFTYLLFSVCTMLWASLGCVLFAFIRYHRKQANLFLEREKRAVFTEVLDKPEPTQESIDQAYAEYAQAFDKWSKGW